MKIYKYTLTTYGKTSGISLQEFNVKETPILYKTDAGSRIKKEIIGKVLTDYGDLKMYTLEPDFNNVRTLFSQKLRKRIEITENECSRKVAEYNEISNVIGMQTEPVPYKW